jgi:hypothetical protein
VPVSVPETLVIVNAEDDHQELERFTIPTSLVGWMNAACEEKTDDLSAPLVFELPRWAHRMAHRIIANPATPYRDFRDSIIDSVQRGIGRTYAAGRLS